MNIFIVTETSKNIRTLGRMAMETKRNTAMLVVFIYGVAAMLPPTIISVLFAGTLGANMSLLYSMLVSGPFSYGLAVFFLVMFRRQQAEVQQVFEGFEQFGKTLGLFLYIFFFTTLWSLLFIIPGIIAALRYSQAYFIMVDHPEYSISQCVMESKIRMHGNKGKYFILGLSFLGWIFICSIPLMIVEFIFGLGVVGISATVGYLTFTLIAMAPYIWLGVYISLTHVAFYEILIGNLKAKPINFELPLEEDSKDQ